MPMSDPSALAPPWYVGWDLGAPRREPMAASVQPPTHVDRESDSAVPIGDLDETALVAACLAGRPGAFDLIVERHRRGVYQLCYRFAGNHEDASDLSQDVFLRAYRGLRTF